MFRKCWTHVSKSSLLTLSLDYFPKTIREVIRQQPQLNFLAKFKRDKSIDFTVLFEHSI